jgi:hypothetical protein
MNGGDDLAIGELRRAATAGVPSRPSAEHSPGRHEATAFSPTRYGRSALRGGRAIRNKALSSRAITASKISLLPPGRSLAPLQLSGARPG